MLKHGRTLKLVHVLVSLSLILALASSAMAQEGVSRFTASGLTPDSQYDATKSDTLVSVLVKLNVTPVASYTGGVDGFAAVKVGDAKPDFKSGESLAYQAYVNQRIDAFAAAMASVAPEARLMHRYDLVLGGVSVILPARLVNRLSSLPGVARVSADTLHQPDTDSSPQFIGAPTAWNAQGGQESAGEGIVVGVLDTGIWPEHPSFSDPDPSGKPYVAPGGAYDCDFGNTAWNANDVPFTCNNKLIGAYDELVTYKAQIGLTPEEFDSARDDGGHGTHTASTAAGNAGVAASIFGVSYGNVSGIAPRAYVVMYKVLGLEGGYTSDIVAGIQQAVADGVDVINYSIGGGANNPYTDDDGLAWLDAYNAGIFVSASAGNSGPGPDTVDNSSPWILTVGASSQKRAFVNRVSLSSTDGASLNLPGVSVTAASGAAVAVVIPVGDEKCLKTDYGATDFLNEIVVCQRGTNARVQKGINVLAGGAVGMILYNAVTQDQETDNHYLPASHIQADAGTKLLNFLAGHPNVTATISAATKGTAKGDVMAGFSSRGGPGQWLGMSKPDITAPGVQILAGNSPLGADPLTGPHGELFQAIAGTSMSSPHMAGSAALLKALHYTWTPGQIKSALMTTAKTKKVFKEDGITPANAFDYGSGRVDLTKAGNPGIAFQSTGAEFVAHENDLWDANYPSIYIPNMPGIMTLQRTAHDMSGKGGRWAIKATADAGMKITVPPSVTVPANGDVTFNIKIDASGVADGTVRFGMITLTKGTTTAHLPVTIVRGAPDTLTVTKTCDPAQINMGATTDCTITVTNTSLDPATVALADDLPSQLKLVGGSLVGATQNGNGLTYNDTLVGSADPTVTVAPGLSPAGYLPLSGFGVPPEAGIGDETIVNYDVDPFIFAGQTYTSIGATSNGYAVVGGGTGSDVDYINQAFPDTARPNNVLAPWWTDLNLSDSDGGGDLRAAVLCDGPTCWLVLDWEGAKEYSTSKADSFQIWIGLNGVEDISFTYGALGGDGDGGWLTVGAETLNGNEGDNYYVDGTGTLPVANTTELVATGVAGTPSVHTITYSAKGVSRGNFTNTVVTTSDAFEGTYIVNFNGKVR